MKRILALAVAVTSQVGAVLAGPPEVSKQVVAPPPAPPQSYFRANEWNLGIFATYAKGVGGNGDINHGIGEHAWGGGLGGSYYPWLYAGFRIQGSVVDVSRRDDVAGFVTGDFIVRYPLDLVWPNVHLAPYAFGGVGGLFTDVGNNFGDFRFHRHHNSDDRVLGDVGGGLEYRFTPHLGLFTEASYNIVDGPKNNFVPINFGIKVAF
jgi:hypothetical protein